MRFGWRVAKIGVVCLFAVALTAMWCKVFFVDFAIEEMAEQHCTQYDLDKALVLAVVKTESGFHPLAQSGRGAMGLMQIMPDTAVYVANMMGLTHFDLLDPSDNLKIGIFYLDYLMEKFDTDWAICAYNAGEGNVAKWKSQNINPKDVPFAETRNYLKKVKFFQNVFEKFIE